MGYTNILNALKISSVQIHKLLQDATPNLSEDLPNMNNNVNSSGDTVKIMDYLSNKILCDNLKMCPEVYRICSEEENECIILNEHERAKYMVAFDPLDGSGNIDVNITCGTIFGIFEYNTINDEVKIVCAGYFMYSSALQMVIASDNKKVELYTYVGNNSIYSGATEWRYDKRVNMPPEGKIYSINQGRELLWTDETVKRLVNEFQTQKRSMRLAACMVTDTHRILFQGGTFMYPRDTLSPNGKLRLLYECIPMAYIVKAAGGYALTEGLENLLERYENFCFGDDIHARTPILLLGKKEYEIYTKIFSEIIN